MLPDGFEMRCCECDLWWDVPGGGVLDAEGALDETVGFGPDSEGAVLAETILTAAVRFFVLKTVVVLPLLRLLLRMGALGPDILTVVVMRAVRPPVDEEDDEPVEFASTCGAWPAPELDVVVDVVVAAAAPAGLGPDTEQAPPTVSAACAAK